MEDRTYKGYEILKMLDEGKIEHGTELIFRSAIANEEIIVKVDAVTKSLVNTDKKEILSSGWLFNSTIQFKKDSEDIDIQNIEIIRDYRTSEDDLYNDNFEDFRGTINELVQAVKQLDNKINKKG